MRADIIRNWFIIICLSLFSNHVYSAITHRTDQLSEERYWLTATSVNGIAFFAGGSTNSGFYPFFDTVDIYNAKTGTWSVSHLSEERSSLASASASNKAFFGGGLGGSVVSPIATATVDIYDTLSNSWTTSSLSEARFDLVATATMDKVFFAGGQLIFGPPISTSTVDIYDIGTDTWSIHHLSQPRYRLAAATVGTKVLFAGGSVSDSQWSDVVDIYDSEKDIWSTACLSIARSSLCAVTIGSRVYFAGGAIKNGFVDIIDVYDSDTDQWSTMLLSHVRHGIAAASIGDLAFFGGGIENHHSYSNRLEIFDTRNDQWLTVENLSVGRCTMGVTTVENMVLFGGGFGRGPMSIVDIYIVPEPKHIEIDIKPTSCPNPLNVKSEGVLPVAILGTDIFDANTIVPTSVRLAGVEPIRDSLEDVTTPLTEPNECECSTVGPDGFMDLTLKFKIQDIVGALGEVNTGDILTLPLTGVLNDETPIEGEDCVVIVGRHKPINKADINKDGLVNAVDIAIVAENWLQSSIVEE